MGAVGAAGGERGAAAALWAAGADHGPFRDQGRVDGADAAHGAGGVGEQAADGAADLHEVRLRLAGAALHPAAGCAQTPGGGCGGVQLSVRMGRRQHRIQNQLCLLQALLGNAGRYGSDCRK